MEDAKNWALFFMWWGVKMAKYGPALYNKARQVNLTKGDVDGAPRKFHDLMRRAIHGRDVDTIESLLCDLSLMVEENEDSN